MSKTYVIQWKSKINGRAGKGTKQFSLEEAETLVQELNQEYPNIHHEIMDSEGSGRADLQSSAEKHEVAPTASQHTEKEHASHEAHAFSE